MSSSTRPSRPLAVLAVLTASLLLGACASGGPNSLLSDASVAKPDATPKSELQKATEYWGKQYSNNPADATAALSYARNLRALGAKAEALAVLQAAHQLNPQNRQLNSEYGRIALEHQQFTVAEKLLAQADDPVAPDWRTISARGTVLAKQGKHHESIPFYERAMVVAPDQPSVMNNLAMAYAMAGQPTKAEDLLRQAAAKNPADARIAHNLALVLGLQGRHDEAAAVATGDAAIHNADLVRRMVPAPEAPLPTAAVTPRPAAKDQRTTAAIAARSKPKADTAVDASEMVRRLADADAGVPLTAATPSPR
jgi:Flp pilus assembly protein TadD